MCLWRLTFLRFDSSAKKATIQYNPLRLTYRRVGWKKFFIKIPCLSIKMIILKKKILNFFFLHGYGFFKSKNVEIVFLLSFVFYIKFELSRWNKKECNSRYWQRFVFQKLKAPKVQKVKKEENPPYAFMKSAIKITNSLKNLYLTLKEL